MTDKIKTISIQLPEDLWNRVTIQAAKETIEAGVKVDKREIVIKALEGYLIRSEKGYKEVTDYLNSKVEESTKTIVKKLEEEFGKQT